MKSILILVLCCVSQFAFAEDTLDQFLVDLKTLQAHFEQKLFSDTGELLEKTSGTMVIQRPGKFRWDYQKPYQQLIVADGERVWIYDVDLEQVTVKTLDNALGKTPALLLTHDYAQIKQEYTIAELPTVGDAVRLELQPKDSEAQFKLIRLTLQDKVLQELELQDNLDQTTFLNFDHFVRNQGVDSSQFIFTPPAGVDVIMDGEDED